MGARRTEKEGCDQENAHGGVAPKQKEHLQAASMERGQGCSCQQENVHGSDLWKALRTTRHEADIEEMAGHRYLQEISIPDSGVEIPTLET